jgi:hypothetical protein
MRKPTQKQRILEILKRDGVVSRNQALSMYISRLAAIAKELTNEGYELIPYREGGNYYYRLTTGPVEPPRYRMEVVETPEGRVARPVLENAA